MMKWHISPEIGPSECRANYQCSFGSSPHFDTLEEAAKFYEKSTDPQTNLGLTKKDAVEQLTQKVEKLDKEWKKLDGLMKRIVKKTPNFPRSAKWFNMVQERRRVRYRLLLAEKQLENLVANKNDKVESFLKTSSPINFDYHPAITSTTEKHAKTVIRGLMGLTATEIQQKIEEKLGEGKDLTTSYREIFAETPLRKDKPIVSIDLETAAPLIDGKVDNGSYSSIIEVGYIIRQPNGKTVSKSYLCGVPDDLIKTCGTGAEEIHHISPDMVRGFTPFVEDTARQKELLNDLKGSVVIAHNALFEKNQFKHSLYGFNAALDKDEIELVDTVQVCKFFMPHTENNRNQEFVEGTGGVYENAHRAYDDAHMTLNALLRLKNVEEVKNN